MSNLVSSSLRTGEFTKLNAPLTPGVGSGYRLINAWPIGLIRPLGMEGAFRGFAPGILLQGSPAGWDPLALTGSGFPVTASHWKEAPGTFGLTRLATPVKSPVRWASVGTEPVKVIPLRWNFCSPSRKKNVLFLMMGPPMEPPNWFKLNFSGVWAKKLLASRDLLRRNSNSEPWNWLPPDLVVTRTVGPARNPNSAE